MADKASKSGYFNSLATGERTASRPSLTSAFAQVARTQLPLQNFTIARPDATATRPAPAATTTPTATAIPQLRPDVAIAQGPSATSIRDTAQTQLNSLKNQAGQAAPAAGGASPQAAAAPAASSGGSSLAGGIIKTVAVAAVSAIPGAGPALGVLLTGADAAVSAFGDRETKKGAKAASSVYGYGKSSGLDAASFAQKMAQGPGFGRAVCAGDFIAGISLKNAKEDDNTKALHKAVRETEEKLNSANRYLKDGVTFTAENAARAGEAPIRKAVAAAPDSPRLFVS